MYQQIHEYSIMLRILNSEISKLNDHIILQENFWKLIVKIGP